MFWNCSLPSNESKTTSEQQNQQQHNTSPTMTSILISFPSSLLDWYISISPDSNKFFVFFYHVSNRLLCCLSMSHGNDLDIRWNEVKYGERHLKLKFSAINILVFEYESFRGCKKTFDLLVPVARRLWGSSRHFWDILCSLKFVPSSEQQAPKCFRDSLKYYQYINQGKKGLELRFRDWKIRKKNLRCYQKLETLLSSRRAWLSYFFLYFILFSMFAQ